MFRREFQVYNKAAKDCLEQIKTEKCNRGCNQCPYGLSMKALDVELSVWERVVFG